MEYSFSLVKQQKETTSLYEFLESLDLDNERNNKKKLQGEQERDRHDKDNETTKRNYKEARDSTNPIAAAIIETTKRNYKPKKAPKVPSITTHRNNKKKLQDSST